MESFAAIITSIVEHAVKGNEQQKHPLQEMGAALGMPLTLSKIPIGGPWVIRTPVFSGKQVI